MPTENACLTDVFSTSLPRNIRDSPSFTIFFTLLFMCVQVTVGEDPDTTDSRVKFLYSMTEWLLMSEMDAGAVKCETVTDITKI